MFPLQNIREHVTEQLDTTVTVFRKFRDSSGVVRIEESDSNTKKSRFVISKTEQYTSRKCMDF